MQIRRFFRFSRQFWIFPRLYRRRPRLATHRRAATGPPTPPLQVIAPRKEIDMGLSAKQRRRKNLENARRSCGPKTIQGKEASRANSLKYGLTAKVLTLPDENPDYVKTE